ncbi:MAG: sigma-70 family RNA polymerase sigma factor [Rhodocyclaceae bacterium]|nr:sigma-70 family RNA polymerase sigma factor [Rhodocyclaceae bacterium]
MKTDELQRVFAAMRSQMLRFARLQLRSEAAAEDAVQEALLAAHMAADQFAGASSVRTWVFSILKNKIIDELRRRVREGNVMDFAAAEDEMKDIDELFDQRGHWAAPPMAWPDPEAALDNQQFWVVFEACLDGVPPKHGRIFMMREILGLETEEICKELAISPSNCWVLLHRARLGLRECLSQRWFGEQK